MSSWIPVRPTVTLPGGRAARAAGLVRLPKGVDREAMRATYEDGLLVVSIPRVKTDNVKRQKIAIS